MVDPIDPEPKICKTCHYWTSAMGTIDDRNICILHTGMKTAKLRKVDFGGNKALRTTADFGCVTWEKDQRKKD